MAPKFRALARADVDAPALGTADAVVAAQINGSAAAQLCGSNTRSPRRIIEVPVGNIERDPNQLRQDIDEGDIDDLAQTIQDKGLINPIQVVRIDEDRFQLVAGERRWLACHKLGMETIPAILRDGSSDADEIAIIDNVQRVDLTPLELSDGLQRLIDKHGYSQGTLGQMVGRNRVDINGLLALQRLSLTIRKEYHAHRDRIGVRNLIEISREKSEQLQLQLWERAKAGMTVVDLQAERRATQTQEAAIDEGGEEERAGKSPKSPDQKLMSFFVRTSKRLSDIGQNRDLLSDEHRRTLNELKNQIEVLLGG
ncbi:MAG: ParB/RepB/Spo0J family partition protein [Rhodospirillaceae bacterium]